MKTLWCFTGAGHLISESVDFFFKLRDAEAAASESGKDVLRIYGLLNRFSEKKLSTDKLAGVLGRLSAGEFDALVLAPCSANTVAKMVSGIADTLPTNLYAQAQKAGIKTLVLPSDAPGVSETILPVYVDRSKCVCEKCEPEKNCPQAAFHKTWIDLSLCTGCGICVKKCPKDAVSFGKKISIRMREIDLLNLEKLSGFSATYILKNLDQLKRYLGSSSFL